MCAYKLILEKKNLLLLQKCGLKYFLYNCIRLAKQFTFTSAKLPWQQLPGNEWVSDMALIFLSKSINLSENTLEM